MRIRDTAKPKADASTTHASHAQKSNGLTSLDIAVPAKPRLSVLSQSDVARCVGIRGGDRFRVRLWDVSSAGGLGLRDSRVGGQMHNHQKV